MGSNFQRINNTSPMFLGSISIFLSLSFILSIFTPTPLALISIFQGRKKGILFQLILLVLVFIFATKIFGEQLIFWAYLFSIIFSISISEIISRNIHPIKGLLISSAIILLSLSLMTGLWSLSIQGSIKDFVIKKVENISTEFKNNEKKYFPQKNKEARETAIVFSRPELLADEVIKTLPLTIFIGVIFTLWINLALLFRFLVRSKNKIEYSYNIKDLLHFKVPDYFIWPLITLLALMLAGSHIHQNIGIIAKNLLFCLGLFYFFQGFGILIELFDLLKLEGFFRSLLIVLTVITSYWILALVGLFDLWVDFRAFLIKKFHEQKEEKEEEKEEEEDEEEEEEREEKKENKEKDNDKKKDGNNSDNKKKDDNDIGKK
ncbi:MAG: DUF2232 domain-containing protein [Oligoflexia bacterium]|nr:DUF2232 domain-containing protein [Oligoflexia bacterium]